MNVYEEGEKLAELAVRLGMSRTSLKELQWMIATRKDRKGIENYIRRQSVRIWCKRFADYLLELLDKCQGDLDTFSRIVGIAHATYEYYEKKPVMEKLSANRKAIENVIRRFADERRLGRWDVSIIGDTLRVRFEKGVRDRRRAKALAGELKRRLLREVWELGRVKFNIHVEEMGEG